MLAVALSAATGVFGQSIIESHSVRPVIGTGLRGDGKAAVNALLNGPYGLAEDSEGNIYISESRAGLIRRVRPDGTIERFAGTGRIGRTIEELPASEADLLGPTTLLVDRDGGLLFADPGACVIRKVHTDGRIRNLAGKGSCGTSGGGPMGGSANPTATRRALESDLGSVSGMVLDDSGRLVFSDETYHVVRRLDTDGFVRTLAGLGTAGFGGDDDDATDALLRSPRGLAYDDAGNLYVADGANCRIRRIDSEGVITTVAGTGTCATASTTFVGGWANRVSIGTLTGLAYQRDSNSLLVASPGQARLLKMDLASGRITSILGDGRRRAVVTTLPQEYSLDQPNAVLISSRAGILVADTSSFAVVQLKDGQATSFAGIWPQLDSYPSAASAPLLRPKGLCIAPDGSLVAVDAGAERVLSYSRPDSLHALAGLRSPTGYSSGDGGPATQAQIADPDRVACAPGGEIYLTQGNRIRMIDRQGVISTYLSTVRTDSGANSLRDPTGLAIDSQGRMVISEAAAHRVIRYDPATKGATVIAGTGTAGFSGDGGSATDALLNSPGDVAIDSKGNVLIADRGNNRIRRISPGGTIQTIAGSGGAFSYMDTSGELATDVGLDTIEGLAVDAQDNLYIAEYQRVSVINSAGRIQVISGLVGQDDNGSKSYIDGPLNGCDGMAVDSDGRLYFSVRDDGQVKVVEPRSLSQGVAVSHTAFGGFSAVAPGTWLEIYASDLARTSRSWSWEDFEGGIAPTALDGVRVLIGGQEAYVSYVSSSQVNAQAPDGIGTGRQQVTVMDGSRTAGVFNVDVNATQPGLFAPAQLKIGGKQYVAAFIEGGLTYAAPSGAVAGAASRPARPGETIVFYGIGFGPVTPRTGAGRVVTQLNTLDLPVQFYLGQTPAAHSYAGLVGIGLYQFNVEVPSGISGEAVPLSFTLGGTPGEQTLYVAIQE
ncbi:MAG: hypothetical protein ACE141_03530 [Bryobacteraceae bacterium]